MFIIHPTSYLVKQTKLKGRGVFARKFIEAGVVIGDYSGTIVDDAVIEEKDKELNGDLYFAAIDDTYSVMPDLKTAGIHLINYSCEPNLSLISYGNHILYTSLRKIFPGEELTVNYLIEPEYGEKNFYVCHCGAPACRGTWYNNSRKIAEIENRKPLIKPSRESMAPLTVGALLPKLNKYPDNVPDNDLYDLYGNREAGAETVYGKTLPPVSALRSIIRSSGRCLFFPDMHLEVVGICGKEVLVQYRKSL